METGPAPFPGYFDSDALDFSVAIVQTILGSVGAVGGLI